MMYLITFCTYGSRIPGVEGIVSKHNNLVGARTPPPNSALVASVSLTAEVYALDASQRETVLKSVVEVARHRDYKLLAAHVRTAHVHVVVEGEVSPERMMNAFKSYASRALNCHRRWARHGSTLYLWNRDEVARAINYVVSKQGEPMAVYMSPP